MFDKDPLTALQAVTAAQWLAFAPLAFQATAVMRDRGVLAALANAPCPAGCDHRRGGGRRPACRSTRCACCSRRASACTSSGAATAATTSASSATSCWTTR